MKILSSKEYKRLKNIEEFATDLQLDLSSAKEDEKKYLSQISAFQKALEYKECLLKQTSEENKKLIQKLKERKNEVKGLKTLLTKNGIYYGKEGKE